MDKNPQVEKKLEKTVGLMAVGNLLLTPLYLVDSRLGLTVSIAFNSAALYLLHELGKSRRPGANMINRAVGFWSAQTNTPGTDVDNAIRNIINGGDEVHKQITSAITHH